MDFERTYLIDGTNFTVYPPILPAQKPVFNLHFQIYTAERE